MTPMRLLLILLPTLHIYCCTYNVELTIFMQQKILYNMFLWTADCGRAAPAQHRYILTYKLLGFCIPHLAKGLY